MKFRKILSLAITLGLFTTNTFGQTGEDVTHYIVNAGFDEDLTFSSDGSTKKIADKSASLSARSWAYIAEDNSVYAWAKTAEEGNGNWNSNGDKSHALNGYIGRIKGWTVSNTDISNCEWAFYGSLPYDLEEKAIPITDNGNTYQIMPSKPDSDNGADNIGALFLRAGWGAECSYRQQVNIPCAKYRLEYWTINTNGSTQADATDLTKIVCRDEVFSDESNSGLSSRVWTKHEFEFMPTSEFTIEFGYKSDPNKGSNNNPHVFIDGVRLYKIGDTNYDEILKTELQNEVDILKAYSNDSRMSKYNSIKDEILNKCNEALKLSDISKIESMIQELKEYKQKISDLLPVLERLSSLLNQAESIKNSAEHNVGYSAFIKEYESILTLINTSTTDNIATYSDKLSEAINDYYLSGGESGSIGIDCSFLVKNPHFTKKGAEPTYDEYGYPSYPYINRYTAGSVPSDGTKDGWYSQGATGGDQRLNFAQGRICWNLWDTSAGLHSINQDITNLPEGLYTVSADMITQYGREYEAHVYAKTSTSEVSSPFLNVGNWSDGNNGEWTRLETNKIMVTDGNLTIGGRSVFPQNSQTGWFCMTNGHLYYYGEEVKISNISFNTDELILTAGERRKLEYSIYPENATFKNVYIESDDPEVVSVDNEGNLIARNEGAATITVYSLRDNEIYAQCDVYVELNYDGANSLIINEIQSANIDMFVDPSFNYGGWIELYNPTDAPVSLVGLYVSDDPDNLTKFKLNIDAGAVPAKGFKNIWFDHNKDKSSQVDFKLSYDGETIYLSDYDGELITSQDFPNAVARTSYARTTDGGITWGLTAEPTPERSNATSRFAVGRLDAPVVDKDAQLFSSPFTVSVNIPSGATLRYTTDGTTPTLSNGQTSKTGVFNVSSTTIYRFRLFKDGILPSEVVTRSYIFRDRDYVLPVISIVTDRDNIYGDSLGILVQGVNGRTGNGYSTPCNWNMDWDRPVNFEYITADGKMVINQEVDMSACGGWSRAYSPHSFKLKADKIYEGKNFYDYPIFETKPYLKHKTLQVRNGGNDTGARIKDAALQEIIRTSGIDVDGQAYQPAVHFINGRYVSMLNIREPNNKHFVYANYGYDSDEIDMFEMSPDSAYCQMTGTDESFRKWYDLSDNAESADVYEEICKMVDIDEYINYMAIELYLGSTDWGRNNVKGYRPRYEDGKFRFVLFDLDFAFNTNSPFTNFESMQIYTFNQIYDTGEQLTTEIELVTIFLNMLENEAFRKKFIDTYCLVAGSVFEPERCKEIITRMAERTYSTLRYEGQDPYTTANPMINSLSTRQQTLINALKNYWRFYLSGVEEQNVKISSNINEARITLNDMIVPTNKFDGSLFGDITLKASAPANYKFIGWKGLSNNAAKEDVIFDKNTEWSYYDQGSLDGQAWTSSTYNVREWASGDSPLGYYTGDNNNSRGYNSILDYGYDASNKRPTYYFRKTFKLTSIPSESDVMVFDYIVDDGFIIYVNGKEAGRYLMPSSNVGFNTFASSHAEGNPDTGSLTLDASLFKQGTNVIAVEVHNNSGSSSDIYFDASLTLKSYNGEEVILSEDETYVLPSTGNHVLKACYEKLSEEELNLSHMTPVKINEICASNSIYINEYFEKNDWIELYNTTDEEYNVAGMYISDNLNKPLKYQIPTDGIVNTVIKPNGFIVLWADKLTPINQLHTSFKIGAEGGEVVLTSADETWCDTLVYAAHNGDYSIGLYPDGGNNAYIMNKPTIASSNVINSYSKHWDEPYIPNSLSDVEISRNGGLSLAYNDGCIEVRCEDRGNVNLGIYTISGQNCMKRTLALTGSTERISISSLPAGTYIVRAADENDNRCVIKIYKK